MVRGPVLGGLDGEGACVRRTRKGLELNCL